MADICMCTNLACPLADTCYRKQAIPSQYQTMGHFSPDKDGICDYYWELPTQFVYYHYPSDTLQVSGINYSKRWQIFFDLVFLGIL